MTTLQPRRAQSHRAEGEATDLDLAASPNYPDWPVDVVQRPGNRGVRARADKIFDKYRRFRTAESWAPGDDVRLAYLARAMAYLEREAFMLAERRGGDDKLMAKWQSQVALFSRQLGLNTSPVDPRLHGSAAEARRRAEQKIHDLGADDGLLAMPGSPSPFATKPN